MRANANPKVLIVYHTFSQQTSKVADAMAEAFSAHNCDVTKALIEFPDPEWTRKVFTGVPMRRPAINLVKILVAQRTRKTGEIRTPPEAQSGDYDLIVFGSPTWWLTTNMPIRTYLKSDAAKKVLGGKPFAAAAVCRRYWKGNIHDIRKLGEGNGGTWVGETHFVSDGNQVTSMLSWLGWMKHGEPQETVFGIKMPPPNLRADYKEQARSFVDGLVDKVLAQQPAAPAEGAAQG